MSDNSDTRWRSLAKWLRRVGFVCCFGFFLCFLALVEVYYPFHRTVFPQPERGWTTPLTWTHPVLYGTAKDENRSQWLFELFLPAFGLIIIGELIKILKLADYSGLRRRANPPWDHKWGPQKAKAEDASRFRYENWLDRPLYPADDSCVPFSRMKTQLREPNSSERWEPFRKTGCTFESANPRYIAVDMPPSANVTALYELLERGKEQGVWVFEEGYYAGIVQ